MIASPTMIENEQVKNVYPTARWIFAYCFRIAGWNWKGIAADQTAALEPSAFSQKKA